MKRALLTVLLVGALCGGAAAQTSYSLGVKAGGGLAKVNISGASFMPGFDGGIFAEIKLASFSIQPEVLYTMKGMKFKEEAMGESVELKWKFNYIEIPILIKRTMTTGGNIKPAFYAGPTLGFLSSAKATFTNTIDPILNYEDVDIKEAFKSTDIGLAVGAGLDFLAGQSGKVTMDLRFTISLSNILDNREALEDIVLGEGSMRNWNITLMLGYGFDLGKNAESEG